MSDDTGCETVWYVDVVHAWLHGDVPEDRRIVEEVNCGVVATRALAHDELKTTLAGEMDCEPSDIHLSGGESDAGLSVVTAREETENGEYQAFATEYEVRRE